VRASAGSGQSVYQRGYLSPGAIPDGREIFSYHREIFRDVAGINAGESVKVTMEKDLEKRTVEVPKDLAVALKKAGLTHVFAKMSFTHQKEYVNAVNEAKKAETRIRRIEKTIEMLAEKKR